MRGTLFNLPMENVSPVRVDVGLDVFDDEIVFRELVYAEYNDSYAESNSHGDEDTAATFTAAAVVAAAELNCCSV